MQKLITELDHKLRCYYSEQKNVEREQHTVGMLICFHAGECQRLFNW